MTRKFFGTDGIRGKANLFPMTPPFMVQLASAVGQYLNANRKTQRVVIGKDTRRSGYMLETALMSGFTACGMDVVALGPVPTPAVGLLTHSMRADLGVMISASHNPHEDNGIKFFGPDGFKLSDQAENGIEEILETGLEETAFDRIGRVTRVNDAAGRYVEFVKTTIPDRVRLHRLKIVLDCANGAAYKAAPQALWELGAEVIPVGVSPNGYNINRDCGSTSPGAAARAVVENGADVGICLDGDADRLIVLDETGAIVDGDQIMALLARNWAADGRLREKTLVATIMSNLGLERYLKENGICLLRTRVGDRYVVEAMRRGGYNMGGEQSGHIVLTDHATTGDGLLAALQFLAILKESGEKASALTRQFEPVPQLLRNVRYAPGSDPLEQANVKDSIARAEARMNGDGRLLIRKSGTEPLIRVMAECTDPAMLEVIVNSIAEEVAQYS